MKLIRHTVFQLLKYFFCYVWFLSATYSNRLEISKVSWSQKLPVLLFLKSLQLLFFRTSPWDAKENLPTEYSKIFKFSNFKQTKKIVLTDIKKSFAAAAGDSGLVLPGSYVCLYIADVPVKIRGEGFIGFANK